LSRATYPVSNGFLSDTHLPHENQHTPYPTHSLKLSAKNEESKRPKSKSLEMKPSSSSSFHNPLKLRAKIKTDHSVTLVEIADQLDDSPLDVVHRCLAPSFSIVMLWVIGRHSTGSRNISAMRRLLPFFCRLDPFLQGSVHWNKRRSETLQRLAMWTRRSSGLYFLCFFLPFCSFLRSSGVSNSATQNSIMNAHNKTQFTYTMIKCALKDSSCDSPISKNVMLTILASNASSRSTKFKASESDTMLTLTRKNTMNAFTHRFVRIFRSTLVSAHSRLE
ncbi:hypothetical protein H5410_030939, partial [Solanum commersonii]